MSPWRVRACLRRSAGSFADDVRPSDRPHPDVGNAVLPVLSIAIAVGAGGDDVPGRVLAPISPPNEVFGRQGVRVPRIAVNARAQVGLAASVAPVLLPDVCLEASTSLRSVAAERVTVSGQSRQ